MASYNVMIWAVSDPRFAEDIPAREDDWQRYRQGPCPARRADYEDPSDTHGE